VAAPNQVRVLRVGTAVGGGGAPTGFSEIWRWSEEGDWDLAVGNGTTGVPQVADGRGQRGGYRAEEADRG
jgi:hypothetical protein